MQQAHIITQTNQINILQGKTLIYLLQHQFLPFISV